MSKGRVLSEEEYKGAWVNANPIDLIATIRDKDKMIRELNERNIRVIKQRDRFEKQNCIMRETLELIRDCPCVGLEDYVRFVDTEACEALVKIGNNS